jgi:hypothetical protein
MSVRTPAVALPRQLEFVHHLCQLCYPCSHQTAHFRSAAHTPRMTRPHLFRTGAAPSLPSHLEDSPRLFHNHTVRPMPPPHNVGSGLRLLHASVAAAGALPALMDTNADGLHLQYETLKRNIHLKYMKHLVHTYETCV